MPTTGTPGMPRIMRSIAGWVMLVVLGVPTLNDQPRRILHIEYAASVHVGPGFELAGWLKHANCIPCHDVANDLGSVAKPKSSNCTRPRCVPRGDRTACASGGTAYSRSTVRSVACAVCSH